MNRGIKIAFFLLLLCAGKEGQDAFAADVRKPAEFAAEIVHSDEQLLDILISPEVAAWVQAFGTIAAVIAAIFISKQTHKREKEHRREEAKQREQNILNALYVEVFRNAARCARDAYTWMGEWEKNAPEIERRNIVNLMKFRPSTPVVYCAIANRQGILSPDIQAALSEFYFRLELIRFDVDRFSKKSPDDKMNPGDTHHFAQTLVFACRPGLEALKRLRVGLDKPENLDAKLNSACLDMFRSPSPLGTTIDEVMSVVIADGIQKNFLEDK